MSLTSFAMVACAALLHAAWNLVVKSSDDRLAATWAVVCFGAIVNTPVLIFAGLPEQEAWGWLVLSALIHIAYGFALSGAYDRVDISAAYPIARGTAPLIVTIVSVPLLGDSVSLLGMTGIVAVSLSLGLIGVRHVPTGAWWAVLTGVMIASYTLSDGAGVRAGDESVRYIAGLFVLHSVIFTLVIAVRRRSLTTLRTAISRSPGRLLFGGAASAGAYLLVMIAARDTPLGLVAGLRETSAVFVVIAGSIFLKEKVSRQHAAAVCVAVMGSILIVLN